MNDLLPSHLSIQEINYYTLVSQYKNWIAELKFVDQEFSFFAELLVSQKLKTEETGDIANDISSARQQNQKMLDKVISHGNQLESLLECEDVACDTFYLNEHQGFKKEVEQHIIKIRNYKTTFFKTLI